MMISAVGRKKRTVAKIHRLMEEGPLWAAAAIQRGPSTAAMLKSRTSQKPIARRSWDLGPAGSGCKRFTSETGYRKWRGNHRLQGIGSAGRRVSGSSEKQEQNQNP